VAHMHYKGTGQMHSFRGLLADGKQERIRIQGATGEIAWRITKFQVMPQSTGAGSNEAAVSIWRESQSSAPQEINFENAELLACAYFLRDQGTVAISGTSVIFDNALFVRNIYVNYQDAQTSGGDMNYYIELEEVKVSAAGMAQLAVAAARRVVVTD